MDTRADFQRLLEDMDRAILAKRQELSELEERLESSRSLVGEREANELRQQESVQSSNFRRTELSPLPEEQRLLYERQLEQLNEELAVSESINQELGRENELLKRERETAARKLEELKGKLANSLSNSEEVRLANLELNLQLAKCQSELQMSQRLLGKLHKEDELLMNAFNDKLELLRKAIESRDQELSRLRPSRDQLESLGLMNFNSQGELPEEVLLKRVELEKLLASIRQRDLQLEQLLKNKQIEQSNNDNDELPGDEPRRLEELENRCKMLESELDAKDRQLHLSEFKIHQYEIVMPNKISDLVQKLIQFYYRKSSELLEEDFSETIELLINNLNRLLSELNSAQGLLYKIDQLREENQSKGFQIERLVSELNQLANRLENGETEPLQVGQVSVVNLNPKEEGEASQQVSSLKGGREFGCQVEIIEVDVQEQTRSPHESNLNHSNGGLEGFEKVACKLESEVIQSSSDGNQSVMMGGGEMIERSINGLESGPAPPAAVVEPTKLEGLSNGRAGELEERFRRVKAENELLELAMKEILLSIKCSDGQCCTILIDCPSLERLCQLIEARHIAVGESSSSQEELTPVALEPNYNSDRVGSLLFQLVLLKSELDLARGQNEQLRAELKVQRRDYVEYLSSKRKPHDEVHCQTDDLPPEVEVEVEVEEAKELDLQRSNCRNCDRLHQLINHLLESIERIQSRVQASEDNYMSRLANLHKLVEVFERDLSMREKMLVACRRQSNLLLQQKLTAESKLELYESQQQKRRQDDFANRKSACRSVILFNNNLARGKRHSGDEITSFEPMADNSSPSELSLSSENSFNCN